MAEDFSRSERTIETHRKNLYTKTGADNLIDLTLFGRKNNWIDEDGNLTEVFFELKRKAK